MWISLLKSFVAEKRHGAMQKKKWKKERQKKWVEKMDTKMSGVLKTMGT